MFVDRSDEKPVSILITTLAAQSYNQEEGLADALFSILWSMDRYITKREGVHWVENPADPAENFADKWADHPERRDAFDEWLNQARIDFTAAYRSVSVDDAASFLGERMSPVLANRAVARHNPTRKSVFPALIVKPASSLILTPGHRLPVPTGQWAGFRRR